MESLSSTLSRFSKVSLLIPLGIALILCSCGPWDDENTQSFVSHDGTYLPIKCRHEAILTYLVFGEQYPVEICIGPSEISDIQYHVQTRAEINGEWQWLKASNGIVFTSCQDPFNPIAFNIPLEEALGWSGQTVCVSD